MTTERTAAPQSRQQIADALEYQLGDDDLPGVWRLNAQDVRTVIEALRSENAPTPELTYEDGREDGLNAAARVCDKRAEKIDDANRCETASVLAYQIRALKKAAPQGNKAGTASGSAQGSDGAGLVATASTSDRGLPNGPAESASLGEIDADCYMPGECGSAPSAQCVEDAIEALWAYSEELHIQCNTPEASRIEGIIHNLNHLSPAHAETSLSKLMKPELAKAFGNKPDAATPNKNDLSPIEWQAILDALEFTDSKASLVSDAHERAQVKVTALCRQFERGSE